MKATIKSIAELANTSSATVSRALSNRGYVGAETRRRIESAALELGYDFKRSQLGQDEQNAKIVLVVSSNLISQVYIDYFKGLTAYLGEKGCFCFQAFSNANPEREVECIRFADQNRFGAVVLLNVAETPKLISLLEKINCPVVLINRYLRAMDTDAVCVDNYRGGYMAAKYLIDAGHSRIVYLTGNANSVVTQDRLLGFQDAMHDAGLKLDSKDILLGDLTEASGERFGEYLAQNKEQYTAAFASNDAMAVGLLKSLCRNHVAVPDDISILSFDTTPIVKNAKVRLTTIGFDSYEMGRAAGELVVQKMCQKEGVSRRIVYPAEIDEGESVKRLVE